VASFDLMVLNSLVRCSARGPGGPREPRRARRAASFNMKRTRFTCKRNLFTGMSILMILEIPAGF
jgi:hypothetical protein